MKILTFLVYILITISIIAILVIAGKGDENYSSSAKRNTTNLILIYAIFIPIVLIALGVFIVFFT
jgi:hypothetical protein